MFRPLRFLIPESPHYLSRVPIASSCCMLIAATLNTRGNLDGKGQSGEVISPQVKAILDRAPSASGYQGNR
jgi:hypothetical protein